MSSAKLIFLTFESKKNKKIQKNAFLQISKNGRMSLAKLHFLVKKVLKKGSGVHVLRAPKNPILGPILGPKIGTFGIIFEAIFWSLFWSPFGPLLGSDLGSVLAPNGPKKGAR